MLCPPVPKLLAARAPSPKREPGEEQKSRKAEDHFHHSALQSGQDKKHFRRPETPERDYFRDVIFEDIEFNKVIGAGSFGQVSKGTYQGKVVAIKQCKVEHENDRIMLLKEIHHLEKLRHPRLVSYLGSCYMKQHVYILLEYMCGGSLFHLIFPGYGREKRKLTFTQKVDMAEHVTAGLTYLHDLNVVHRDLKTLNIILDDKLNCKICDFGLTVTLERTHMTVRSMQGSPRYMAPEQFESTSRITEKVDIWAMGCVMLELFCDVQPFANASGLQHICNELLVKKKGPLVPAEADPRARVLIRACFAFEPKQRPTAETLEEALESIKADLR